MSDGWRITADKFLTQDQIAKLLEYLRNHRDLAIARGKNSQAIRDFYILRGLLESGLRVFELCALMNEDFIGHKLTVKRGKGNRPRTVILTRSTANLFKEWAHVKQKMGFGCSPFDPIFPSRYGRAYTTRGIQSRVEIIFSELGFPENLSTHSLRHTYCSLLLERTSLAMAKENMGHGSIATTNLYSHAIGNLDNVELYSPISHNSHKYETQRLDRTNKSNNIIKSFLGNANFKP